MCSAIIQYRTGLSTITTIQNAFIVDLISSESEDYISYLVYQIRRRSIFRQTIIIIMLSRHARRCRKSGSFVTLPSSRKSSISKTHPSPNRNLSTDSNHAGSQYRRVAPLVLAAAAGGFFLGRHSVPPPHETEEHLPNGMPRTCCDRPELTEEQKGLFRTLKRIVGRANILDGREENSETAKYLKGARLGKGSALFVVKPQKLKEVVEVIQAVVDANCVVLVQGSNTGLTGGSVPRVQADRRPTVVVSMKAFDTIFPIDKGERVVCLAGVGLATLSNFVEEHFNRESHSILGSTFLNPTTAAGVSLGSGGTQMRKGPAYTERALYLKVVPDKFGKSVVSIVNTLGIEDLDSEEGEFKSHLQHDGIIRTLDKYVSSIKAGHHSRMKQSNKTYGQKPASDMNYKERLCQIDKKVNRYNADTNGAECNRSEGKVLILASVHDTFPKPTATKTFWMSFDSFKTALEFRRRVCLDNPHDVPISMEYMDRDSFDVIDQSGRLLGNTIKFVGASSPIISSLWNFKIFLESMNVRGASSEFSKFYLFSCASAKDHNLISCCATPAIGDTLLFWLNPLMPSILPSRILDMGKERDHHIAITVGDFDGSLDRFLERLALFRKKSPSAISVHECQSPSEVNALTAFRFVAAPAFRTYCVGNGVQGFSVDYALPRDGGEAPPLPVTSDVPLKRMRYSHFGCNVVHEDVAFPAGVAVDTIKYALKNAVEHDCHGRLPAEHGHGTEYQAPEETRKRWMAMDPLNLMNPGVGGLPSTYRYTSVDRNST